jgi:ribosomal protein L29
MATKTKPTKSAPSKVQKEIALVDMNATELAVKAKELKAKIAKFGVEKYAGKMKNIKEGYSLRKQLARTLTVLNQKLLE